MNIARVRRISIPCRPRARDVLAALLLILMTYSAHAQLPDPGIEIVNALATSVVAPEANQTEHKTINIDGVDVFYREAGPVDAPTILLLHGFPTSSHMFRNLIPALSDRFHLVAPDYPGFGNSEQPSMDKFDYTFDGLAKLMEGFVKAKGIEKYSVYLMDYGAPIGFRLIFNHCRLHGRKPRYNPLLQSVK